MLRTYQVKLVFSGKKIDSFECLQQIEILALLRAHHVLRYHLKLVTWHFGIRFEIDRIRTRRKLFQLKGSVKEHNSRIRRFMGFLKNDREREMGCLYNCQKVTMMYNYPQRINPFEYLKQFEKIVCNIYSTCKLRKIEPADKETERKQKKTEI